MREVNLSDTKDEEESLSRREEIGAESGGRRPLWGEIWRTLRGGREGYLWSRRG